MIFDTVIKQLLDAIHNRMPTFLEQEKWKLIPFSESAPSHIQQLINKTTVLPSILERIDILLCSDNESSHSKAEEIQMDLYSVLLDHDKWENTFASGYEGPISWPVLANFTELDSDSPTDVGVASVFPTSIFFPNITVANTMIHYWSFTVVILSSLQTVYAFLQSSGLDCPSRTSQCSYEILQARKLDLASKICQSMEYLMQKEMKLYGPASTFQPLAIAKKVFRDAGTDGQRQYDWCQQLARLLVKRGLILAEHVC